MKVTVFGASRGVGRAAVDAALTRGYSVTAVARTLDGLAGTTATPIAGDALDPALVERAIDGADAVLVALGTAPGQTRGPQSRVCSLATATIVRAMVARGPRRIVVVSSYGVGPTRALRPFPFNLVAATLLREIMADKEAQERDVRASPLAWTIAQPLGLTDGPPSGAPLVTTDGTRGSSRVARADVAAVCIDAIESERYVGASIAISGPR